MRRNTCGVNSAYGITSAVAIEFSVHGFLYLNKISAIFLPIKRTISIFSLRIRRNDYLGASGQ